MLKGKLIHKEESDSGCEKYDFSKVSVICTHGFNNVFGDEAGKISLSALESIITKYGHSAEYFQVFEYILPDNAKKEFWVINDDNITVTMLLPEEY